MKHDSSPLSSSFFKLVSFPYRGGRSGNETKIMAMLAGKIQTVLGVMDPSELHGAILPHEHLLVDFSKGLMSQGSETLQGLPLTMENLGSIRRFPYSVHSNLVMDNAEEMISELQLFKEAGGGSTCEQSVVGMRCNPHRPELLAQIARETGINVIHGTGFYADTFLPKAVKTMSVQEMAGFMEGEICCGVEGSDVKCGLVYIGCSWPLKEVEKRALKAAAIIQKKTGVPLVIRSARNESSPFEILDFLSSQGADISHTAMSHIERTIVDDETLLELARRGCYLIYSHFGKECSHYQYDRSFDMPSDAQRIQKVKMLIENGFKDRVMISHDNVCKHELVRYGGHGYAHILEHIVSKMVDRGISRDTVMEMIIENPKNWLTFAGAG